MIAYFNTSAVIPLLIAEAGSGRAGLLWSGADRVVSARLVHPEGRAALAEAHRAGRLTAGELREAVRLFEAHIEQIDVVELDERLARTAGDLSERHGLRGHDAVHLASADRARDGDLVVVAGDGALLRAATAEGMATAGIV